MQHGTRVWGGWLRAGMIGAVAAMVVGGPAPHKAEANVPPEGEGPLASDVLGDLQLYYVQEGDTMLDIAMRYRIGYVELLAANPDVDPWLLPKGSVLVLPEKHLLPKDAGPGIMVNLGDLRVYYFPPDGGAPQSWPISVGREAYETPIGIERVTELTKNPTWIPTKSYHADNPGTPYSFPPGPDNPLGDYRIRVGWDGYAIHGTNKPEGLGRRVSRGCVRMYPADVEQFFQMLKVGVPVAITDQPVKFGWIDNELYMEVHPFGDEIDQIEFREPIQKQEIANLDEQVFEAAGKEIGRVDWAAVYRTVDERRGIPVRVTR